jgi:hypothetical protein
MRLSLATIELAVTMPLVPSHLEKELAATLGRPGGFLTTSVAFSRLAQSASRRLVVMTPFIDAGGFRLPPPQDELCRSRPSTPNLSSPTTHLPMWDQQIFLIRAKACPLKLACWSTEAQASLTVSAERRLGEMMAEQPKARPSCSAIAGPLSPFATTSSVRLVCFASRRSMTAG